MQHEPERRPRVKPPPKDVLYVSRCCGSALLSYNGWRREGRRVRADAAPAVPFRFCLCQTEPVAT